MMFRSFLLQALFGDTGRSKDSGGGGGINTTGNNATTFPKVVVGDEMSSSFPSSSSFSSPSTPSSYSKRKKVVLLVFFCILFGGIFFLFGAFEIVRGMMTMSSSASLGESSVQQQVYKRSDEKNRGWKGEDEEGEDDEDDDAIETNARDRRREYDAESRTTTRMSESEEMMFQTRLASASEKCLRAPVSASFRRQRRDFETRANEHERVRDETRERERYGFGE